MFPDIALYLKSPLKASLPLPPQALVCLRFGRETTFSPEEQKTIMDSITMEFETTRNQADHPVYPFDRQAEIEKTLAHINTFGVVITDRLHLCIFTIIVGRPVILLPSGGNKTKAFYQEWLKDIPCCFFTEDISKIPHLIEKCFQLQEKDFARPDWRGQYFDKLPHLLGLASEA